MPYCVHCGVELDRTAMGCPLCHTPVIDPGQPVDTNSPKPFPTQKTVVEPASKVEVALLLSVMFASVGLCCGILNLLLQTQRLWSLYVIGAAVMLWLWLVPPLIFRKLPLWFKLLVDALSIGVYVFLISVDLDGGDWFVGLALPIVLLLSAIVIFLGFTLAGGRRSILTSITMVIASIGVFLFGVELFVDRYVTKAWSPGWSLAALAVCVALVIPLVVVRRIPNLREEVRRRFHM